MIGKSFEVVPAFQLLLEKLKGGDSSAAALSSIHIVILKLLVKVKFVGLGTKTTLFEPFSSAKEIYKEESKYIFFKIVKIYFVLILSSWESKINIFIYFFFKSQAYL